MQGNRQIYRKVGNFRHYQNIPRADQKFVSWCEDSEEIIVARTFGIP